jgi:hypothetical protein
VIARALLRESSTSDRNAAATGDPEGWWSPRGVIRSIRATAKMVKAIKERYSDELLVLQR